MKKTIVTLFLIMALSKMFSQDIIVGFTDSIHSKILDENREFMVKLPKDYHNSDKSYPVIYRLDGNLDLYIETVGTINRLVYTDETVPEIILVMISNTTRNRDMMPTQTSYYQTEPGAENFRKFIELELIPHIEKSFRTTKEKLLCGQSLSSLFTLYHFLTSAYKFDSYIVCSGGFPDCEEYFLKLADDFLKTDYNSRHNIFLTYGQNDFLDPKGVMKNQILNFTKLIESKENITSEMKIYEEEGHVPFPSLYHALKFIYNNQDGI